MPKRMSKRPTKGATPRSSKLHGSCRLTCIPKRETNAQSMCTHHDKSLIANAPMHACRFGDRVTIAQLLRCGAKLDPTDADGQTAGVIMLVGVRLRAGVGAMAFLCYLSGPRVHESPRLRPTLPCSMYSVSQDIRHHSFLASMSTTRTSKNW